MLEDINSSYYNSLSTVNGKKHNYSMLIKTSLCTLILKLCYNYYNRRELLNSASSKHL
jgi:hypothetical protein